MIPLVWRRFGVCILANIVLLTTGFLAAATEPTSQTKDSVQTVKAGKPAKNGRKDRASIIISCAGLSISVLALAASAITTWRTYLSPYRLRIAPPTISQVNDLHPSLLLDLAFYNFGARKALVSDMAIRTFRNSEPIPVELFVQRSQERFDRTPNLVKDDTKVALFIPFVVASGEPVVGRFHFSPYEGKTWREEQILQINRLQVDFLINSTWKRKVFDLGYADFSQKFKGSGVVDVPEGGFWPHFYKDVPFAEIKGSFWS